MTLRWCSAHAHSQLSLALLHWLGIREASVTAWPPERTITGCQLLGVEGVEPLTHAEAYEVRPDDCSAASSGAQSMRSSLCSCREPIM